MSGERFGSTRIPVLGVLDETGAIVFDDRGPAELVGGQRERFDRLGVRPSYS